MPRRSLRPAVVSFILVMLSAAGHCAPCGPGLQREAEASSRALDSWDSIYRFYGKFAACDDGGLADSTTESIVRLLADKPGDLDRLGRFAKLQAGFSSFVVAHIDSTANTDDLKKIYSRYTRTCPVRLAGLCKDIAQAAHDASEE